MQFWDNLTMRMSWTLVLLAFLTLLLVLSGTGLYAVDQSRQSIEQLTQVNVNQQAALNRTNSTLQSARLDMAHLYEELIEQDTSFSTAGQAARGRRTQRAAG